MKIISLLLLIPLFTTISSRFAKVDNSLETNANNVSFSAEDWEDYGKPNKLWSIDEDLSELNFYSDYTSSSSRKDQVFTGNLFLTDQFDIRDSQVSVEATFQTGTTSNDIITNNEEVHLGIVPWYKDNDNWIICYAKFSRCADVEIKDGHIFDFQFYAKINGTTHVEYYVKDDGNTWVSEDSNVNSEWHSAWPDRINVNKSPSTLQDLELDPSEETKIFVRKTRKVYAGKNCDSFYATINNYELNFALDNFMFSGFSLAEEEDENLLPKVGFYLYGTRNAAVKNISINVSKEIVLPLPTIEPLTTPVQVGTINKEIAIPEFMAIDNNGLSLEYTVNVDDPNNNPLSLDSDEYFIPLIEGEYNVTAKTVDDLGYEGKYSYKVKVKLGTNHIDTNVYDDILTNEPVDTAIITAYVIFISVPIIIVLYIGLKIFLYYSKKRKDEKV